MAEATSFWNKANEASSLYLISTNFGLWHFFLMISRTEKYGKWSDMALRTMPEYSALFLSFNRQNIWSINVADILVWCFRALLAERCDCTLDILVGYMICGKKLFVTNKSKYAWNFSLSSIFRRSRFMSPVMTVLLLFLHKLAIMGLSSLRNFSTQALELLFLGGRYMFPIVSFPSRFPPCISINKPSHKSESRWISLISYENSSLR